MFYGIVYEYLYRYNCIFIMNNLVLLLVKEEYDQLLLRCAAVTSVLKQLTTDSIISSVNGYFKFNKFPCDICSIILPSVIVIVA